MIIGIACNKFPAAGGMERYVSDVAKSLIEKGHQVVIFTKKYTGEIEEDFGKSLEVVSFDFKLIPNKLSDFFFEKWINKERKKYRLDFLLTAGPRLSFSDVIICGGTHQGFISNFKRRVGFFDRIFLKTDRDSFRTSGLVIAHSKLMEKELREYYQVPSRKIKTIYPPIDARRFSAITAEERMILREKFGFPADRKVFLFPSTGHIRKGYPFLETFFEKTSLPVLLVVVGRDIPKEFPTIRYAGYSREIENYYRAADYTILASEYEPFGLVAPESILCGTPVVMPKSAGCCEVIKSPGLHAFENGNLSSLTKLMERLCAKDHTYEPEKIVKSLQYDYDLSKHVDDILNAWTSYNSNK